MSQANIWPSALGTQTGNGRAHIGSYNWNQSAHEGKEGWRLGDTCSLMRQSVKGGGSSSNEFIVPPGGKRIPFHC